MKKITLAVCIFCIILLVTSCSLFGTDELSCDKRDASKSMIPKNWIWIHYDKKFSDADWEEMFTRLTDTGISGIHLMGETPEEVAKVVTIADTYEIDVHAWIWIMNCRDPQVWEQNPDWFSVNRELKSLKDKKAYVDYYRFLCPALPEVREYLKKSVREWCQIKGLKGIHFDYIRFIDVILPEQIQPNYNIVQDKEYAQWDYGYHPAIREMYKAKYGIDPIKIKCPGDDKQWKQFRYDLISEVVSELAAEVRSHGKMVSAAVFPSPTIARKHVRQDWENWPLDHFFPMVYHNFYYGDINWIKDVVTEDVKVVNASQGIYCGFFIPGFKSDQELEQAIKVATKAGASGIALFDYKSIKESQWKLLKRVLNE